MNTKGVIAIILSILCNTFSANAADVGLKISAGKNWYSWGDYILGQDLKRGIESLGHTVFPAYMDNYYPVESKDTSVDIYMHGFIPFNPPEKKSGFNVLYLYYPLETSNTEKFKNLKNITEPKWMSLQTELWDYGLVAVASETYQKKIEKLGLKTIFVPQFTNEDKFFPEYDETKSFDILFVGRPGYERISAKWAMESGFDVALFGSGWQKIAPPNMYKGEYIDNKDLHVYYSSAKIVLNDTREDMKKDGFISNRVFDVTASGGFLISDYMPEIEKHYGDSIPMFKTREELANLLDYYLKHPEEREKKAKKAREVTLNNFTAKVAAKRIFDAISEIKKDETAVSDDQVLDYKKLAIKSPWPHSATNVGEYWLGLDIEKGLKNSGLEVKNYYLNRGKFNTDDFYDNAGNLLYLQFKYNMIQLEDEQKNRILYMYFPTEILGKDKFKNTIDKPVHNTDISLNDSLQYFDLIATPAKALLPKLIDNGYNAVFIPQFTNDEKFKYEPNDNLKTDLLFVGSPWYERVSVSYAIKGGYDIAVYGSNWKNKIPEKFIKGGYIDNNKLNQYYSSAKIVLSDHPDDLAEMGLVINRLYDVSATGAFIISEYSPYIEEIFGDTIPMFKNEKEFNELVSYYLENPDKRKEKALQAQAITLEGYTNNTIGKKFNDLFNMLSKEKL